MPIPDGLLDKIEALEPLPITAQRLMEAAANEQVTVDEVTQIIEFDEAVTANIMRSANSALYSGVEPTNDPRVAVLRLGKSTLLNIALQDFLKRQGTDASAYDLSENELWLHAAVASIAVDEAAQECGRRRVPSSAQVAALIHDIGKLIITRYAPREAGAIRDLCTQHDLPFTRAEREVLGCDHAEVGGAMARKWGFLAEITRAVEEHHMVPVLSPTPCGDAVITANLIAKTLGIGLGTEGMNIEIDLGISDRLGLDSAGFSRACAETAVKLEALKEAYGFRAAA
jgi:putative nucleotidyltransferase with HDIG domain